MNAARRKAIEAIKSDLEDIKGRIETIQEEEQEYFDNMPEGLQSGSKGEAAEGNISCLEEAANAVEEACDQLTSAMEGQ